jgi:hypothetical protein
MSAEWIDAEEDGEAIEAAKKMMDGHPRYEVWERSRLVIRLEGRKS